MDQKNETQPDQQTINEILNLLKLGKLNNANELLDIIQEYHPNDVEFLYARANIQYSNQDWTNLLKTYHSIYLSDPDNMDILLKIYEIGLATDHISIVLEIIQNISIENEFVAIFLSVPVSNRKL